MGPSGSDEDDVLEIHSGNSASSSPPKKKVKAVSQPQVVSVTDAAQVAAGAFRSMLLIGMRCRLTT
eukprot:scaffold77529_cov18-Tisochrysis_lutea.AAC.1